MRPDKQKPGFTRLMMTGGGGGGGADLSLVPLAGDILATSSLAYRTSRSLETG